MYLKPPKYLPLFLCWLSLMLATQVRAGENFTLEEPGFYFITNNPYTEPKKFFQVAVATLYSNDSNPNILEQDLVTGLQIAYGFTDRLEASLTLEYDLQWNQIPGPDSFVKGFEDTLIGLRYRFLTEKENPITLAFGPQFWLPTGNVSNGFGAGGPTLAWDLTIAKEWNRWFFHTLELNYATTFSAVDPNASSSARFTLHNFFWSLGLGFRPIERDTAAGSHHDFHVTLEFSGTLGEQLSNGSVPGLARVPSSYLFVPGVKYGYSTKDQFLTEIGVAGVIGLNQTPDWGLILQTQWEFGI